MSVINGPEKLVFVAQDEGRISCVDADKREILWTFSAGSPFGTPPSLGEKRLYLTDEENSLYVLDFEGNLLSKNPLKERMTSPVVENGGRIYVGTETGKLMAIDALRGEAVLWEFQAGGPIHSAPVFHAGRVIFGADDGRLYALDRDGRSIWSFTARGKIRISAHASERRVVFGTEDRWLYCLNPLNGKRRWAFRLGGSPLYPPTVIGNKIVMAALNSVYYCLSAKNGEIIWWKAVPSRLLFDPVIWKNRILVSSASPEVTVLDLATGDVLGSAGLKWELSAGVLWLDPQVIAVERDPEKAEERVVFLKKEVGLSVSPSIPSPQPTGEAIEFKATAVGFYRPKFEFAIVEKGERNIVQDEGPESSWTWIPENSGSYKIQVRVVDEKQIREIEIPFIIEKRF